ncbi:dynein intermediate chain 2, ciliary-like isoform X2 [Tachypleus tridentatus]|uniref:dynein intermediate chain 2, ciliary-like isoform X2 n=1 Tax=Tachypleus tridentatus TaxID=6853 RepID=UPI003FCF170E
MPVKVKSKKQRVLRPSQTRESTKHSGPPKTSTVKGEDDESYFPEWNEEWTDNKTILKPVGQVPLSEEELKQEVTRILKTDNPQAPQYVVRFSFREPLLSYVVFHKLLFRKMYMDAYSWISNNNQVHSIRCLEFRKEDHVTHILSDFLILQPHEQNYMPVLSIPQLIIHYEKRGNLIPKKGIQESTQCFEGKQQETLESFVEPIVEAEEHECHDENIEEETALQEAVFQTSVVEEDVFGETRLKNKFNFYERAAQTYNNPYRERGFQTQPPPQITFSASVTQWDIYDSYQTDFVKQEKAKEKKSGTPVSKKDEEKVKKESLNIDIQVNELNKVERVSKIVKRMVSQNTYDEITQDFKYWEDPSDEFKDFEGMLLPLWYFSVVQTKKLSVTSLSWNPRYPDLFVVGHGSYDYLQQTQGEICLYSLKSPSHPERIYETDTGVYSVDFHPQRPHFLVVGMCDGSISIFNLKEKKNKPVCMTTDFMIKHTDPVWEVKWINDDLDGNMNFCSVAADGRAIKWTVIKMELIPTEIVLLKDKNHTLEGPDGTKLEIVNCGTAIAFHRENPTIFLVGVEEGVIYKCSSIYSSPFLAAYKAHYQSIYSMEWNYYHSRVFISCSADWMVCIWDHTCIAPVFTFDLHAEVGDIAWAPYSSTVFAAITANGKVHIYDLSVNKHLPICQQTVEQKKKTKLTKVAFNPSYPILCIGDERGHIVSLKLSPNLRKNLKDIKNVDLVKFKEVEGEKMEKILELARDSVIKEN